MRTYTDRTQMDERYERTIVQLMESQAYRELAAAHLFGFGLRFAPEMKWIKFMTWHIREEVEHFEAVGRMYKSFTGEDVTPVAMGRLTAKPHDTVDSWFELAMAQFLFDRGGFWQLKEYDVCSFLPYLDVILKVIDEEAGHQGLGERMVKPPEGVAKALGFNYLPPTYVAARPTSNAQRPAPRAGRQGAWGTLRGPPCRQGLSTQKRKTMGRVPRSLGSDKHRTDGDVDVDDDDEADWEVAQPARAKASRASASVVCRFMAIF